MHESKKKRQRKAIRISASELKVTMTRFIGFLLVSWSVFFLTSFLALDVFAAVAGGSAISLIVCVALRCESLSRKISFHL